MNEKQVDTFLFKHYSYITADMLFKGIYTLFINILKLILFINVLLYNDKIVIL